MIAFNKLLGLSLLIVHNTQAIILNKDASWSKAIQNHFLSPFLNPQRTLTSQLMPARDRTIPESSVSLIPDANWKDAWEKNLSRQTLYNNIVKEVFNSLTRIIGWSLISFVSLCFHQ